MPPKEIHGRAVSGRESPELPPCERRAQPVFPNVPWPHGYSGEGALEDVLVFKRAHFPSLTLGAVWLSHGWPTLRFPSRAWNAGRAGSTCTCHAVQQTREDSLSPLSETSGSDACSENSTMISQILSGHHLGSEVPGKGEGAVWPFTDKVTP